MISRKGTVNLSNMNAFPNPAEPSSHNKDLFSGVAEGDWIATKFETTPPVRISTIWCEFKQ
jgi:aminopeptidase 2